MQKITNRRTYHFDQAFRQDPIRLQFFDLEQIGEQCLEPKSPIEVHRQTCHEISYIISGSGYFSSEGTDYSVTSGDLIINAKGTSHGLRASDHEPMSFAYVAFHFRDNFPDSELIRLFQCDRQIIIRDQSRIYTHFRSGLDEFYREGVGNRLIIEACLLQITVWTARNMTQLPQPPQYESLPSGSQVIRQIQEYVEQHISEPMTIIQIAEAIGYNPFYLSHLYRERTGMTLQDYIIERRIHRAKYLLEMNRYTFTEIGEQVGYLNHQSFNRVFKKKTGMTPSEYLRQL